MQHVGVHWPWAGSGTETCSWWEPSNKVTQAWHRSTIESWAIIGGLNDGWKQLAWGRSNRKWKVIRRAAHRCRHGWWITKWYTTSSQRDLIGRRIIYLKWWTTWDFKQCLIQYQCWRKSSSSNAKSQLSRIKREMSKQWTVNCKAECWSNTSSTIETGSQQDSKYQLLGWVYAKLWWLFWKLAQLDYCGEMI